MHVHEYEYEYEYEYECCLGGVFEVEGIRVSG